MHSGAVLTDGSKTMLPSSILKRTRSPEAASTDAPPRKQPSRVRPVGRPGTKKSPATTRSTSKPKRSVPKYHSHLFRRDRIAALARVVSVKLQKTSAAGRCSEKIFSRDQPWLRARRPYGVLLRLWHCASVIKPLGPLPSNKSRCSMSELNKPLMLKAYASPLPVCSGKNGKSLV